MLWILATTSRSRKPSNPMTRLALTRMTRTRLALTLLCNLLLIGRLGGMYYGRGRTYLVLRDFTALARQVLVQNSSSSRARNKIMLNQTMLDVPDPPVVLVKKRKGKKNNYAAFHTFCNEWHFVCLPQSFAWCSHQMFTSSLGHANRGFPVGAVFFSSLADLQIQCFNCNAFPCDLMWCIGPDRCSQNITDSI